MTCVIFSYFDGVNFKRQFIYRLCMRVFKIALVKSHRVKFIIPKDLIYWEPAKSLRFYCDILDNDTKDSFD